MTFTTVFIVIILLYTLCVYLKKTSTEIVFEKSNVDNREYLVRNLKDKHIAANHLANIRSNLIKLVSYMSKKYPSDKNVERMKSKFDPNVINEGSDDARYTSYTVNKGEDIVFCLRSRDKKDKLHDFNKLLFVAIHELSHIMSETKGHNDEFRKNFTFLLKNAVTAGIYKPHDFNNDPQEYCGIQITDTPLYDT